MKKTDENQSKFSEPLKQDISNLWFEMGKSAKTAEKNKVALAYLSHVSGANEETIKNFENKCIFEEFQEKIFIDSRIPKIKIDYSNFWNEISKIFPKSFTEEQIKYLKEETGFLAVMHFISQLENASKNQCTLSKNNTAYFKKNS